MVKKEVRDCACRDATASYFVVEVKGEVFEHFHTIAVKPNSSIRN
jgi:hypothetical protein